MNCADRIAAAFPKLVEESSSFLPDSVTDAELSNLAADIGAFYIQDVPPFLGALLYAIAKNPPRDPWQWEKLISYLNANLDKPYFAGCEIGRDAADIAAERKLRAERQKDFEQLPDAQIEAVRDWLSMAQQWGFDGSMGHEIRDALHYWKGLAAHSGERKKNEPKTSNGTD